MRLSEIPKLDVVSIQETMGDEVKLLAKLSRFLKD